MKRKRAVAMIAVLGLFGAAGAVSAAGAIDSDRCDIQIGAGIEIAGIESEISIPAVDAAIEIAGSIGGWASDAIGSEDIGRIRIAKIGRTGIDIEAARNIEAGKIADGIGRRIAARAIGGTAGREIGIDSIGAG